MSLASLIPILAAAIAAALAVAGLVRLRRPLARLTFAGGMLLLAVENALIALSVNPSAAPGTVLEWQQWRLVSLAAVPGLWVPFSLAYARGASARRSVKRRILEIAAAGLPLALALAWPDALVRLQLDEDHWSLRLGWLGIGLHSLLLVGAILVLVNLERTYRASVGTMRWRIKFMLMGVGLLFIVRVYTSSQILLFTGVDTAIESVDSAALLVGSLLIFRSIFRDGRVELDVYPSQAVLQKSLTVILAGIYLIVVGLAARMVAYLGGDSAFALKAFLVLVSIVALAVVLQSDHVRLHVRQFVSRHFQRPLYDYRAIWKKFTEGLAHCVEQEDLCRSVTRLTAEVFEALSVSLFLVNETRDGFVRAASTTDRGEAPSGTAAAAAEALIQHFKARPDPVEFEGANEAWADILRRWHPSQFPHGGARICVPLKRQEELVGLLVIGDRVAGVEFTVQDFDMLRCVADQVTAGLLNLQLSRRLLEAKELEAFQTMATFFVHDLKNAASTLNLMLKNLPVHFDDPEFRQDALRGIGKTVDHINRLISRLGLLRHAQTLTLKPGDLNDVVIRATAGLDECAGVTLAKALAPTVPTTQMDAEQLQKVVTNLVLNAVEASSPGSEVRVETGSSNSHVHVTVSDRGCGMSEDFMRRSLFRPFQTTKKAGLGIGMFQSKMIVEAHGGHFTVASELGKGTTFQVHVPIRG